MARKQSIYKVIFHNQGQVVELYARQVTQGGLFGFVEVEGLIFGGRSQVVVDPSEESLRTEFGAAKRLFVRPRGGPDRVEREGTPGCGPPPPTPGGARSFPVPASASG